MAKSNTKKTTETVFKVNFGKKKHGKGKKRINKHDKSEKNYRGQGR